VRPWTAISVTAAAGAVFAVLLAAADGWQAVVAPARDRTEYWPGIAGAKPAGQYLRHFLADQGTYSIHVQGHPPGMTLLLLGARALGLGSAWFVVGLAVLGTGLAVAAVADSVRRLFGTEAMRSTLPFLVLAPYAVWQLTSADAFYGGVAATGIALLVVAMTSTSPHIGRGAAVAGGALLGGCCFLTFGLPTLAPLIAAIAWRTRRLRWIVPAAAGAAVPFLAMSAAGYWWLDGLANTRRFYAVSAAAHRPYWFFLFANLAVLCIAVGPAVIAGALRITRNPARLLVAGALACVLLADISGLSKAETERIWLLYMPWLAVAGASAADTSRRQRRWLGAQAGTAVLLQVTLRSHW
jgi:methylthioxylose transferase